ncbi:putative mitochondrial mitochondrial ornithine carrier protein-like protein [Leptomonas pyrrhocoris]|uniref:Putative mitochondrial mitochondrial ornithine carrier protein-like protein n=1 Tax=Leptomonas pyrrhocoris TaxID=157538 RepID=A0A0N0DTP2_LEPPY|nr:putative mitochondrial mitochondrial ornithine carrier protein-like protein [Leptomonas pyrrhocoris]KPA77788.1 putative mitochondrial mitochondrial ornithine carrier protein-like protein [Leptomonas pyrrhocoris]|eukprot:XP_015656227.1 putative mitochondrial mitochondrial ornithine carrier protein-like protein [Leptomonas pyrrhocoris]
MSLVNDFVSGSVSGVAGMLIEYPFDTVKVLLQTYGGTLYSGYVDCITKLFRQDGVSGFYRGVSARLIASGFEHACVFVSYRWTLRAIGAGERPTIPQICVGGCGAGVASMLSLTPFELVKCKMQADNKKGRRLYRSSLDCARKIVRADGLCGLYKGGVATLYREVPGTAAWCGTYDTLKSWMTPEGASTQTLSIWQRMFAGGCSGVAFWTAFYPSDVVKTRIQVDPAYSNLGVWRAMARLYREGGVGILYRGWTMTAARSFPSNAVIFAVFDGCNHLLSGPSPVQKDPLHLV